MPEITDAAFKAGIQHQQMMTLMDGMKSLESKVDLISKNQEAMALQLAEFKPLAKLFWAIVTAAIIAVGASGYAVILASSKPH